MLSYFCSFYLNILLLPLLQCYEGGLDHIPCPMLVGSTGGAGVTSVMSVGEKRSGEKS